MAADYHHRHHAPAKLFKALVKSEIRHLDVGLRPDAVSEAADALLAMAPLRLTAGGFIADAGGRTLLYLAGTVLKEQQPQLFEGCHADGVTGLPNMRLYLKE